MKDRLHPSARAITSALDPTVALAGVRALASDPPADWDPCEWLAIAVGADGRSLSDPMWLAVKAFAHENVQGSTFPVDALRARAQLIVATGEDNADPFRSLSLFTRRAEAFVGTDTPDHALAAYQASLSTIFTVPQGDPAWLQARDVFLRCRHLRDFGRVLVILIDAGIRLPAHLHPWTAWASLKEDDFVIAGP